MQTDWILDTGLKPGDIDPNSRDLVISVVNERHSARFQNQVELVNFAKDLLTAVRLFCNP